MDISLYFEPIDTSKLENVDNYLPTSLGEIINIHKPETGFPDFDDIDIAIIGVEEDRNAISNEGCAMAPDYIRNKLYQLYQGSVEVKIADLGNIKRGNEVEDTYFALSATIAQLIQENIVPVIIGGGQDLTYANYCAYENLKQTINIVLVSSSFDLGVAGQELDSKSYLSRIILHQPNFLFNYSNIGYQSYFVDENALGLMKNLYFDVHRLGYVRSNVEETEPIVRNADMLSFDISAVRQSDAPGNLNSSPNGFYGEEACQIVRYAGLSDKLTSIGFYEVNPVCDQNQQTVHLVAQMIWYFIEGYYNRKKDFPIDDKSQYTIYRVSIQDNKHEIVFYKSKKSDKWWMNVPYPANKKIKYERHHLVPCSYNDYQTAINDDIPDRWWQAYRKLS
ncbi:MAG: formimidoylglutamase [Bacteroidota bacterium]